MGQGAIAGVGGTRLCDWWFTEDAVLIDTAGRYTTQDLNADVDRAGWEAFLGLLKQTRPKQPLNGLIIAFPISDIANGRAAERKAHAVAIRSRIEELQARFGIRMPVYLLVTKVDLVAGFTEFFDDLDRDQRGQVWGATFELADRRDSVVELFTSELRVLIEQLNARLFNRTQAERDVERRARIAMFPGQMASLEGLLADFLHMVFDEKRDGSTPQLRGVDLHVRYPGGNAIRSPYRYLARALGVDQSGTQSLRPVQGRSYFLERLLKEVIFGEASLVAHSPAGHDAGRIADRRLRDRGFARDRGGSSVVVDAACGPARDRGFVGCAGEIRADRTWPDAGSGCGRRSNAAGSAARSGTCLAARRRGAILVAAAVVTKREARRVRPNCVSPCAAVCAAAAADVAIGDAVAR